MMFPVFSCEVDFIVRKGGEDVDQTLFEEMLCLTKGALERFVYYKLPTREDAEDILQDVYITAFLNIHSLTDEKNFKAWLIRIAQNKCNDYYRSRYRKKNVETDIPINESEALAMSRFGIAESNPVQETLEILGDKERQVLNLYFFEGLPQSVIAKQLGIPVGTVKSRLFKAKQIFKVKYPYPPKSKGDYNMIKLPNVLPEYRITKSDQLPFTVKWEELLGWFLIPKLGEELTWAMYDFPERIRTNVTQMKVIGKASVHGVEGVEIIATGNHANDERHFIAQLTDTHCRTLAESHIENGVKKYYTFLDSDDFLQDWGFGEDNCGNETDLLPKGRIKRNFNDITCDKAPEMIDVVGKYLIEILNKSFDTVCVMVVYSDTGVATEQFIDHNGRTVLWRRFNRDDWAMNRYKQKWSERLPLNERIYINGETYVHWYDCITNYIL